MPDNPIDAVKALTFDVFGTVVDWRSSLIDEGRALGRDNGIEADWEAFADAWRGKYQPSLSRVRNGEIPWTNLDSLHRASLDALLQEFAITGLDENDKDTLNRAWHRLRPWPDSVAGLGRLKKKYILATLSNGNVALLTNMAKSAALPWDCILSAELFNHYKPDPEVYHGAARLLGLANDEVMMVAAHKDDLFAAKSCGLRTAFVARPLEYGPKAQVDVSPEPAFDFNAGDFIDLAAQLGA